MPKFRPDTWDEEIYNSIVLHNEYEVGQFAEDDIIVDIGCHIGSFTILAKMNGAGQVYAYEALSENYLLAVENTTGLAGVQVYNKAVTRSDVPVNNLYLTKSDKEYNTGGGTVCHHGGQIAVDALSFDEILTAIAKPVRLIKFDCEGSEFPILFSSRKLDMVQEIVGEYHNLGPVENLPEDLRVDGVSNYNMDELHQHLTANNFTGTWHHIAENLGKFRYRRNNDERE